MVDEGKIIKLEQELLDYKEITNKELGTLKTEINDHEQRIKEVETSKQKTDFQYEQIMDALQKINDQTIPNLIKEIEDLKNKPVKRYDQAISAIIGAVFGSVGTGIASMFLK